MVDRAKKRQPSQLSSAIRQYPVSTNRDVLQVKKMYFFIMFPQRPLGLAHDETRIKGSTNTEVETQTKNFTKLGTFIIHAKVF